MFKHTWWFGGHVGKEDDDTLRRGNQKLHIDFQTSYSHLRGYSSGRKSFTIKTRVVSSLLSKFLYQVPNLMYGTQPPRLEVESVSS